MWRRWLLTSALALATVAGCGDTSQRIDSPANAVTALNTTPTTTADPTSVPISSRALNQTSVPIEWLAINRARSMNGTSTIDQPLAMERLAGFAEVAVRGQIVALGRADYLVAESARDAFSGSTARLARETAAAIATPVVLRVHEVLARRPDLDPAVTPGDELTIWVSGGEVNFIVTPEDAERTGLRPDISDEEEQAVIDSGVNPPSGPGPAPEESFEFGSSSPEFVSVVEGQEVVAFLRWSDWYDPVANDGSNYDDLLLLLALDYTGAGLFVRDEPASDSTFAHAATGAEFQEQHLVAAATAIDGLTGRAPTPGWLGRDLYATP